MDRDILETRRSGSTIDFASRADANLQDLSDLVSTVL